MKKFEGTLPSGKRLWGCNENTISSTTPFSIDWEKLFLDLDQQSPDAWRMLTLAYVEQQEMEGFLKEDTKETG